MMPHSTSSATLPLPSAMVTIEGLPARSDAVEMDGEEPQTRQALVRKAMDGLQRFKQSWKSVMLLKAGVGLSQVIVLIVLLILATTLSSPLFPSLTQTQPSDACPHPGLFQAWMGVQIGRLTICWSVSCWMLIRTERRRRRQREEREADDREEREVQSQARPSIQINGTTDLPRNADSFSSRFPPSLVHSTSSTSTLITAQPSSPSTPQMSRSSSSRLDLTCVLELDQIPGRSQDDITLASLPSDRKRSRERSLAMSQMTMSTSDDHLAPPRPSPPLRERQSMRSLRQARGMFNGDEAPISGDTPARGFAGWLDRHAMNISRSLGVFSTILFCLGNILLFYPPPSNYSCYAANPLLWWGVLTVTAVGWVLLLQVFFVVVIVGLGGAVVLNALQRLGVMPAPAEPEPPRAAQPDPLTSAELAQIKVVCYLPESSTLAIDRLPLPPVYLSSHQATCAICQENFEEPKEGRTILLKADMLRQLGCSHVYHMPCIDQWLLKGSGNCPSCNAPVRPSVQTAPTSVPNTPRNTRRGRRGEHQGSPV